MALVSREATEVSTGWIGSIHIPADKEGDPPVTVAAELVLCQDGTVKMRTPHQTDPPVEAADVEAER